MAKFPKFSGNPDEGYRVGESLLNDIMEALQLDRTPLIGYDANHENIGGRTGTLGNPAPVIGVATVTGVTYGPHNPSEVPEKRDANAYHGRYKAKFVYRSAAEDLYVQHTEELLIDTAAFATHGRRRGMIQELYEGVQVVCYWDGVSNYLIPALSPPQQISSIECKGGAAMDDSPATIAKGSLGSATAEVDFENALMVVLESDIDGDWKVAKGSELFVNVSGAGQNAGEISFCLPVTHGTQFRLKAGLPVTAPETVTVKSWALTIIGLGRGWRQTINFRGAAPSSALGQAGKARGAYARFDLTEDVAGSTVYPRSYTLPGKGASLLPITPNAQSRETFKDELFFRPSIGQGGVDEVKGIVADMFAGAFIDNVSTEWTALVTLSAVVDSPGITTTTEDPPYQCCYCEESTLFLEFENSGLAYQRIRSVVTDGMIVHTVRITCTADLATTDIELEALDCDVEDCKSVDYNGTFVGGCDIGIIWFGNAQTCVPTYDGDPCVVNQGEIGSLSAGPDVLTITNLNQATTLVREYDPAYRQFTGQYPYSYCRFRLEETTGFFTGSIQLHESQLGTMAIGYSNAASADNGIQVRLIQGGNVVTHVIQAHDWAWHELEWKYDAANDRMQLYFDGVAIDPGIVGAAFDWIQNPLCVRALTMQVNILGRFGAAIPPHDYDADPAAIHWSNIRYGWF